MEISYPNAQALTDEEQQALEKLKEVIEKVIADGVLTGEERNHILALMMADHKITPQELQLLHTMIREKVACGELDTDFFS